MREYGCSGWIPEMAYLVTSFPHGRGLGGVGTTSAELGSPSRAPRGRRPSSLFGAEDRRGGEAPLNCAGPGRRPSAWRTGRTWVEWTDEVGGGDRCWRSSQDTEEWLEPRPHLAGETLARVLRRAEN